MMCKDLDRPNIDTIPRRNLGEMVGDDKVYKPSASRSLTLNQTYKNHANAIMLAPSAVKQALEVSEILGMGEEHLLMT